MRLRTAARWLAVVPVLLAPLVAAPAASAWLPSVGSRISLFAANLPLRTNGAAVYFAGVDAMNEMDVRDASFTKVKGLDGSGCVSFESVEWPGHYLRHRNLGERVELSDAWWDPWFRGDATFCSRPWGYSWSRDEQLEAANSPGTFLQVSGNQLVLGPRNGPQETFREDDPVSLGRSIQWNGWTVHSDGSMDIQVWAACTGLTPPWSSPRTSVITAALSTGRIVVAAAVSTGYMGFYPKITLIGWSGDYLDQVYAIRRELIPCVW